MKILSKYILIIGIIFIILYSYTFYNKDKIFFSPDENTNLYLSQLYSSSGNFYYNDPLNNNLDQKIIHPRGIFPYNNKLVTTLPIGGPLIWGTLITLKLDILLPIFIPFISVITLIFLFLLLKEIFNESLAFFSTLTAGILAPIWYFSSAMMVTDMLWIFFDVAGTYYFFKLINSELENKYIFFSALFFGMGLLINYKSIFWLFSLGISLIIYCIFSKKTLLLKNIMKKIFPQGMVFVLFIITLLYLNYISYGNPLTTGYSALKEYAKTVGGLDLSLIYLDLPKLIFNIKNYLFFMSIYTIMMIIGIISLILNKNKNIQKNIFLIFFLIYSSIIILYLGNIASAGTDSFSIDASFLRYTLPIFLFSGPFIFLLLKNKSNITKISFILILIIINVTLISFANGGIDYSSKYRINSLNYRNQIINNTEPNAVIITAYYDKILFPHRKIADISLLNKNIEGQRIIDISLISEVIKDIEEPMYVISRGEFNIEEFIKELNKFGLTLDKVKDVPNLYKVIKLE